MAEEARQIIVVEIEYFMLFVVFVVLLMVLECCSAGFYTNRGEHCHGR
jgi:hypothetical protein